MAKLLFEIETFSSSIEMRRSSSVIELNKFNLEINKKCIYNSKSVSKKCWILASLGQPMDTIFHCSSEALAMSSMYNSFHY